MWIFRRIEYCDERKEGNFVGIDRGSNFGSTSNLIAIISSLVLRDMNANSKNIACDFANA